MKKIFTLILIFLVFGFSSIAQTNYDFETWTTVPASNPAPAYDDPTNWNSLNSLTSAIGSITCFKATAASDVHSGSAAIKLVTKLILNTMANGLVTTGIPHASPPSVDGGVPYTFRPDSIIGWYKYSPVNADNGFMEIQLLGAGGINDTIGYAIFRTPNASISSYTRFAVKINYRTANPIVKSIWILSASASNSLHFANSTMYLDDIQLGSDAWLATDMEEQPPFALTVGPNPASHFLTVKNSGSTQAVFVLFDVTGRIVEQEKISSSITTVDVADLPSGLYIYSITDDIGSLQKTGKVFIQK